MKVGKQPAHLLSDCDQAAVAVEEELESQPERRGEGCSHTLRTYRYGRRNDVSELQLKFGSSCLICNAGL